MILWLTACCLPNMVTPPPPSEAPGTGVAPAVPAPDRVAPEPAVTPVPPVQPGEARPLPGAFPLVGLAARAGNYESVLTIHHPDAEVVLEATPAEWADVPSGAPALGFSSAGTTELRFRGMAQISAGCDGGSARDWALFDASTRLPEGPVLVVPADTPRGSRVDIENYTHERGPASFLPLGLGLIDRTRTSDRSITFQIRPLGGGSPLEEHFTKPEMDGGDLDYDEDLDDDVFVPTPTWAVEQAPGQGLMLVEMSTWEGQQYTVYAMGAAPKNLGSSYLYWCAF